MRKRRSLPAMVASTAAPLSRVTRNDVLGRTSVTVPSSSIRSSLEIRSSGCELQLLPVQHWRLTYLEAGVQIQAGLDPASGSDPLGQIEPDQPVHEGSPYAGPAHGDHALVPAVPVASPAEVAEDDGFGEDAAQTELEAREPVGVADRGADVLAAHRGRAAKVPEPLDGDVPARRPAAQRECRGNWTGERMHHGDVGHGAGVVERAGCAVDADVGEEPESVRILAMRSVLQQRQSDDASLLHVDVVREVAAAELAAEREVGPGARTELLLAEETPAAEQSFFLIVHQLRAPRSVIHAVVSAEHQRRKRRTQTERIASEIVGGIEPAIHVHAVSLATVGAGDAEFAVGREIESQSCDRVTGVAATHVVVHAETGRQ